MLSFYQKKRRTGSSKNFQNSGMVGCRKPPKLSLGNVLIFSRCVYDIVSHFNDLILA